MNTRYIPPEATTAGQRRKGQRLTLVGAVLFGCGVVGTLLATVLKVVWLGVLGGPIGLLSGLAVFIVAVCFIYGFKLLQSARSAAGA